MTQINLAQILNINPNIDPKMLERSRAMREQLKRNGLRKATYNLASPHEMKRATVQSSDERRTVELTRRYGR